MSRFKAVFLDMGGTVLEVLGVEGPYREILAERGCAASPEQIRDWLIAARGAVGRPAGGDSGDFEVDAAQERARREAVLDAFLVLAGVRGDRDGCRTAMQSAWVGARVFGLYPEVPAVLAALKAGGLVVGAVSNWEPRLPELCAHHGIASHFDFILASESEGFAKPGRRLFQIALERAGVEPHEAIHAGDHLTEDVQAAESAGIRAALVRRGGSGPAGHTPCIPSLHALIPLALSDGWLRGRVISGKGEAAGFTRLPWVREQVAERLGFELSAGTLNLEIERPDDAALWAQTRQGAGIPIEPAPGYCAARCYPVSVEGQIPAAVVLPLVPGYPDRSVEVIAPVSLRTALGLKDGSELTLAISPPG